MPLSDALQIWEYHDTERAAESSASAEISRPLPPPGITEEQAEARVRTALQQAEQRWADAASATDRQRQRELETTMHAFARERDEYFRQLEGEVVHLALAVARKVLMREASVDPELLTGLVRVALDRLGAGPAVTLHVPAAELAKWKQTEAFVGSPHLCEVVVDALLPPGACRVETDRGTASFGLEGQLKAIEQGLLDVLARRPPTPVLGREAHHPQHEEQAV